MQEGGRRHWVWIWREEGGKELALEVELEGRGVNIPYAQLDIISIQFNFTTTTYARSLKETQSQDRHIFILGNPQGEENPAKLPLYRCIKSTKTNLNRRSFSFLVCISLCPMRYTQVCVCVYQMRNTHPLFILFLSLDLFP